MSWRKFLNELLIMSPLVFILCITVHARTSVDDYVPAEYSPSLQEKICSYIEPVRLVESAFRIDGAVPSPHEVRRIAETWRDLTAQGVLRPLPPEGANDSTQDGVKAQIRTAAETLATALQRLARAEANRGEYEMAVGDALLAIEVTQGIKFSDLKSVGMISIRQNVSMEILRGVASQLPSDVREATRAHLEALRESEMPLVEALLVENRVKRVLNQADAASRQELELMMDVAASTEAAESSEVFDQMAKKLQNSPANGAVVFSDFRFAWMARKNNISDWRQVEQMLRANDA